MDAYLTVTEVAVMVRLSVQTIRRYTRKKQIPYHKINRTVRYKKSEIEQWVEKREASSVKDQNEKIDSGLFDEVETGGEV